MWAAHRHDLLRAEPPSGHDPSSLPKLFSRIAWSKKTRSGQPELLQRWVLLRALELAMTLSIHVSKINEHEADHPARLIG